MSLYLDKFPHIEITIRRGPGGFNDRHLIVPIAQGLIGEATQTIDWPSYEAEPLYRNMLCTPPHRIAVVMEKRKALAEAVAKVAAAYFLEDLCRNDTLMGNKVDPSPGRAPKDTRPWG